ncbi:MAG: hypothetical protein K0U57_07785 [Alphaproteobacteria bacterium]|jgi:hypothetical protein|nr:hypothetical protein [Alphaproteobacteria bacterium]
MNKTRLWIINLLVWLCATPAWANWEYYEFWLDPINKIKLQTAETTSDTGIKLNLYRNPNGRVYILFTLPENTPDFAETGVVAQILPEGFTTKEIELREEPGRFVEYGFSTGRALRARLWHGQEEAPTSGTLLNLINAASVTGLFRLADGTEIRAIWSLEEAGLPIAQALGIKIEGVASGPDWENTASRTLIAAMTACQFPKLNLRCVKHVTDCSIMISKNRDLKSFEVCISDFKTDS